MESRAKVLGHPLHPILIVFPGELVDRLGIGVDPGAYVNAPSSLSGHLAHEGVSELQHHE